MAFTAPKASTTARGYGAKHQKLRAKLLPTAWYTPCVRCGQPMLPGQKLHLDHNDTRTGYLGFSHAWCNKRAGAKKGNRISNRITLSRRPETASRW